MAKVARYGKGQFMEKGPLQQEMEALLIAAFNPTRLVVTNDSINHRGHSGDNGTGESHFSISIESAAFSGMNRVLRQRKIYSVLGDLAGERIHAIAIKANVPGE